MWWPWLVAFAMAAFSRAEEEHFLDVKQIVKGTIEAVAKLPIAPQNGSDGEGEKNPEDFYKLFQLPADIMTKLAADAGYIEAPTTTTNGPWIVRRKVHKSSEEQSFTQDESEEEEEEPRRRKKHRKTKDPTLISIRDILSRVGQTTTTPAPVVTLSPAPEQHPPPLRAPNANIASLPVVQSSTDLSRSQVQPQYIYQPIVQPDGKTYYQQVLILPGQVLPGGSVPTLRPTLLHADKSSFVQERPLQPKSIVQADYAMAPPTFPPPVEVFQRASSAAPLILSPRPSIYPTRYVTPSSQRVQEEPMQGRVQLPMSDPLPVTRQAVEEERESTAVPKESLYTTVLPSEEEQRTSARVFHEEASVPPKQVMKTMQASPLRIRTIDSHVEEASSSETNAIRALKRQEELKKAMERHRLEIEPQPRRRKIRKAKKSKKLLKKSRYTDDDSGAVTVQSNSEEFRTVIRRMPETKYLHRIPILTPPGMRTHERVHASKTWKRRRFEPDDGVSSLESIEGKKSTEDDVTEPPKKRRRTRKTGKSKRARSQVDDMVVDDSLSVSKEETTQPDDGVITTSPAREESREDGDFQETAAVTSAASRRRLYRMRKITPQPEWSDSENQAVVPRKRRFRSHSKRIKKIKRSRRTKTSTSPSTTTNREQSARLRQQCLNIRTFARQFGTNDISEFTQEHCAFIENYYPELTCEKRNEYVAECKRYL